MMAAPTGRARSRKAVGPDRPAYFDASDVDRVMAILLALVSEVASVRERLDAHERIAQSGRNATFELVEEFVPDTATERTRETWREAYIRRLFRVITEDIDAMPAPTTDSNEAGLE